MCGVVGQVVVSGSTRVEESEIRQMLAMIRHRGPDEFGIYLDQQVGLGNARLSIIDLTGGQQPISNADDSLWILYNGEVFNFLELRSELTQRGHRFKTHSDTEVILHLFEEFGPACLERLNGQFAIAIWDRRRKALFLARDRLGVRPLFYTLVDGLLVFASEVKAILAVPRVTARIRPSALMQLFTFWSVQPPHTIFEGIQELPPGCFLMAESGTVTVQRYWELDFPVAASASRASHAAEAEALDQLRQGLTDAVALRLRADVPVGAYLSGGLDSSIIAALIRQRAGQRLTTFSITFDDPDFDESAYQLLMARHLGTDHQVVRATHADIGRVFPDVIWHTETPVLRTAPAPMFLLSKLVRDNGFKVVLTGEGADEFLAGYDLFREAKVRRFWARQPDSLMRPLLLKRLYRFVSQWDDGAFAFQKAFFKRGLTETDAPDYSHRIRWQTTRRAFRFLNPDALAPDRMGTVPLDLGCISYPAGFTDWSPLAQAQYLEIKTFLSPYLLSSQGDRMGMAHSVEGRFPFLDHRLVELCNRLPDQLKLRGMTEKYLLKTLGQTLLPSEVFTRLKRPFRAPIQKSFFGETSPDYVRDLLSPQAIAAAGLFQPKAVQLLVDKVAAGARLGETDEMALVGMLSTQLLHQRFIQDFQMPPPLSSHDRVKIHRADRP
ncbi:asparagine synthase (glutamine-hydrolyzing) [Thiocapsa imhoffii]|uniref:asparagine synthase (glutamine-hydrolyzing) n=1 Tax=Thiocapsa imhoffii TaxID=382777 RepID=A0A9X0WFI9_9GAMM|nr:asparagine synthase (glutamine-hydrolyzing) [Thiocapsa imhoffii]MBK1643616.1 asparagine synthase (glutamine-hydrolyzing) [Thiocapsa imhoffii]